MVFENTCGGITQRKVTEMNEQIKKRIVQLICDTLDDTNDCNFFHNIGVVDGMERVLNFLLGGNTDENTDIQAAYGRLRKRLYP